MNIFFWDFFGVKFFGHSGIEREMHAWSQISQAWNCHGRLLAVYFYSFVKNIILYFFQEFFQVYAIMIFN